MKFRNVFSVWLWYSLFMLIGCVWSQDNGLNDANGGPLGPKILTPGRTVPNANRESACKGKYEEPKPKPDEIHYAKVVVYTRYSIEQADWPKYTVIPAIGWRLGGAFDQDNLRPVLKDSNYGVAQKAQLDDALYDDVCTRNASYNETMVKVVQNWIGLWDQKFKKTTPPHP